MGSTLFSNQRKPPSSCVPGRSTPTAMTSQVLALRQARRNNHYVVLQQIGKILSTIGKIKAN